MPGRLYRAGVVCLLLAGTLVGFRLALRHAWRPQDFASALSFIAAELLLLPAAIVLLAAGVAWDVASRRTSLGRSALAKQQRHERWLVCLIGVIAIVCAGVFCCLSVPVVAQHWGWVGLGPPVPVRTLDEVSDITCLTFPVGSRLLYGEYDRFFEQHLRAVIVIPTDRVDEFPRQPLLNRGAISETDAFLEDEPWTEAGQDRWPSGLWRPDSALHFLSGQSDYHGYLACWSWLISLDDPRQSLLYLVYWDKGPGNAQAAVTEFRAEAARDAQRNPDLRKALPGTDATTAE